MSTRPPRYRFADFTLLPGRRLLLEKGVEVPLIPRYFDLLVLLVRRRGEALSRRDILDEIWSDVVVSDGALNQAVRILRRALRDRPREARFIRTVQRHGYRFVYPDVIEEADEDAPEIALPAAGNGDAVAEAIETLLHGDEESRREAAESLHALDTAEALRRLKGQRGQEKARAVLRDSRWDVPGAGRVPLLGHPGGVRSLLVLFKLRLRQALRLASERWLSAGAGGAAAGAVAGLAGGLLLRFAPGSDATGSVVLALPVVGAAAGGLGAVGVGGGMAAAEAMVRSARSVALIVFGALGGGMVGVLAHGVGQLIFEGLFGGDLSPVGGGLEGLVIGAATGLGYALATPIAEGGMATPRGSARLRAVLLSGVVCAAATALLGWRGSYLGAMSLDLLAQRFSGSQVSLEPLARLLGEDSPGLVTRLIISGWEGLMFGAGVVLGLTRRPN